MGTRLDLGGEDGDQVLLEVGVEALCAHIPVHVDGQIGNAHDRTVDAHLETTVRPRARASEDVGRKEGIYRTKRCRDSGPDDSKHTHGYGNSGIRNSISHCPGRGQSLQGAVGISASFLRGIVLSIITI
eukprot:1146309-Prorocentrum_minimum.AAC.2